MKKYCVTLPCAGLVYLEDIEAESEHEAIETALGMDWVISDVEEMNMYKELVDGNVCNVMYNKAEAEEM